MAKVEVVEKPKRFLVKRGQGAEASSDTHLVFEECVANKVNIREFDVQLAEGQKQGDLNDLVRHLLAGTVPEPEPESKPE